MTKNDGNKPAFPQNGVVDQYNDKFDSTDFGGQGITIRDYIAIHASEEDIRVYQEITVRKGFNFTDTNVKYTREQAKYRYADAMIKEREVE